MSDGFDLQVQEDKMILSFNHDVTMEDLIQAVYICVKKMGQAASLAGSGLLETAEAIAANLVGHCVYINDVVIRVRSSTWAQVGVGYHGSDIKAACNFFYLPEASKAESATIHKVGDYGWSIMDKIESRSLEYEWHYNGPDTYSSDDDWEMYKHGGLM